MAYYEMMPAGLPAGLQAGMDSVLNKKFGTATSYAPGIWPDTVNLMGPLPEKTIISWPIADFSDGADDVPTKSLVVTIPPTLSGVSSVTETQTGRNLLNGDDAKKTANNIRFYYSSGKYYSAGTYTLSISENVSGIYVRNISTSTNIFTKYNSNFITFTLAEKTLIGFDLYKAGINHDDDIMLEVGSTAHAYEPYQTPTQYTASLGRTIYGGQADIVNGEGTETEKGKWLSELSWTQNATYPHVFNGTGFTDRKKSINWNNATCLSDRYTGYTSSEVGTKSEGIALATGATNTTIYVSDDRFETVAEFTASLETDDSFVVLPLETPTDFTFTGQEVPTRLGYNAFWSDEGDTEVTYRADINLALQALSGLRGLMMARPQLEPETEPEETIEETPEEMER